MTMTAHAVSAEKPAPCLARQPILTKDEKIMGYEVLFRELPEGPESTSSSDHAPCGIVDTVKAIGFDVVSSGHFAFIPCAEVTLLQDALFDLPDDKVVAQIQPDIPASPSVMEACERLRKKGYKIAIGNYRSGEDREQLLRFADFVKIDWSQRGTGDCAQIAAAHAGKPYKLVAQNVDSRSDYRTAEKTGFTLFEGYFFHHPEKMRVRQIPAGQTSKLRLLQAVSAPEIDLELVEELIRHDASLCYRLMRYLNSPLLGLTAPVQTVRQAINLLGVQALTRWVRTATALSMGQNKNSDLMLASLIRARFCELISPKVAHGDADLFLLGMFSLMDVILETPVAILMDGLAFESNAKEALLAMHSGGGTRLSPICDLTVAREKGDWTRVNTCATNLNLSLQFVNRAYIEAMEWAHQMTRTSS